MSARALSNRRKRAAAILGLPLLFSAVTTFTVSSSASADSATPSPSSTASSVPTATTDTPLAAAPAATMSINGFGPDSAVHYQDANSRSEYYLLPNGDIQVRDFDLAPQAWTNDSPATDSIDRIDPPGGVPLPNTTDQSSAATATTIPSCYYYNTARGLGTSPNDGRCPPLHQSMNQCFVGTGVCIANVEAVDHTGSAWPVHAAVTSWENGNNGSWDYVYGTSCSAYHCFDVNEGRYGCPTGMWYGLTTYTYNTSTHHMTVSQIQLNDSCSMNTAQHRATACMEIGHALGLNHNTSTTSCMHNPISTTPGQNPTSDDFGELNNNLYNHND